MSDEYLGVLLIGVERVAVEEGHGPDRGVGGHVEEQAAAENWVGHTARVGSKFQAMEESAEITAPGHVESISSSLTISGSWVKGVMWASSSAFSAALLISV